MVMVVFLVFGYWCIVRLVMVFRLSIRISRLMMIVRIGLLMNRLVNFMGVGLLFLWCWVGVVGWLYVVVDGDWCVVFEFYLVVGYYFGVGVDVFENGYLVVVVVIGGDEGLFYCGWVWFVFGVFVFGWLYYVYGVVIWVVDDCCLW